MTDTSRKEFTEEDLVRIMAALRLYFFDSIPLSPNEEWKLRVGERENPGLAKPSEAVK